MFANILLDPAAIASWIAVGLASAWIISKFLEEPSYGTIGDLILGVIGGLVGGFGFGIIMSDAGLWGSIVVAAVGASIVVGSGRVVSARSSG